MPRSKTESTHNLIRGTQTASMWLDESGSRTTARDCFVVAGLKTRHADHLQRELAAIRDEHQAHTSELKFGRIDGGTVKIYNQAIEMLADNNVRLVATVVQGSTFNPFKAYPDPWRAHAHVIGLLVQGNINRNEVVTVVMDGITTPPGVALGQVVKREVNGRIGATAVIDAFSLNSKSNGLLQLADLVAGSIFYQRLKQREGKVDELKMKTAHRLARAFDLTDFTSDARSAKLNITTLAEPKDPAWRASSTGAPTRGRSARR